MYKLSTATIFKVDVHSPDPSAEMEEEWPPFKKVCISLLFVLYLIILMYLII